MGAARMGMPVMESSDQALSSVDLGYMKTPGEKSSKAIDVLKTARKVGMYLTVSCILNIILAVAITCVTFKVATFYDKSPNVIISDGDRMTWSTSEKYRPDSMRIRTFMKIVTTGLLTFNETGYGASPIRALATPLAFKRLKPLINDVPTSGIVPHRWVWQISGIRLFNDPTAPRDFICVACRGIFMEYLITTEKDLSTRSSDQWTEAIVAGYLKKEDVSVQNPWGLKMISAGVLTNHRAIIKFWSEARELPPDQPPARQP